MILKKIMLLMLKDDVTFKELYFDLKTQIE
jgi:hypothetical protein